MQPIMTCLELFLEVDEDGHVVLQQLRRKAQRVGRKNRAVRPDLDRELVVVGDLTQTSSLDKVIHLAHRRVDAIDGDKAQPEIAIEVLISGDVAAATLQPHLHIDLAALGDGADIHVVVEDLDIAIGFDHARGHNASGIRTQVQRLRPLAVQLEGNLLQIEDDVRRVLNDTRDGLELVQHAFDANGGDGSAFDRRKQGATKRIADGRTEAALKRLRRELTVLVREGFGFNGKTLGFLEASPKHVTLLVRLTRDAFCEMVGWFGCRLGCRYYYGEAAVSSHPLVFKLKAKS